MSPSKRLRRICLALPGAQEKQAWSDETFRVRGRIFAMSTRGDGRLSVRMTAPEGAQDVLIAAAPDRAFRPPSLGHKGRIGLRLDEAPDREEVAHHPRRSYAVIAP